MLKSQRVIVKTPEEAVEATEIFIKAMEDKTNKQEVYPLLLNAKNVLYEALDAGRITNEGFSKSMGKLSTFYFRFKRDYPLEVLLG